MEGQLAAHRLLFGPLALLCACVPLAARADDAGPRRDIADVRYAATSLLAHRLRVAGIEPKLALVRGVVVVKDEALLTWSADRANGIMGMTRYLDRWWDDFDQFVLGKSLCVQTLAAFPLEGTQAGIRDPRLYACNREFFTRDRGTGACASACRFLSPRRVRGGYVLRQS